MLLSDRIILYKGRMGNSDSLPLEQDTNSSALTLQHASTSDPLRSYLQNRPPLNVKTFTDLEANSKRPLLPNQHQPPPLLPSPTLTMFKENQESNVGCMGRMANTKGRFSHNLLMHSAVHKDQRRVSQIEGQFKAIAISQQSFLKVRKEAPSAYYQFGQKIGQGTFGQVFRAVHLKTQQERAIKVLKLRLMKEERRKEFLAEMSLLSRLNHPSIITLYELFSHNGSYYVVMEYCQGGTIMHLLDRLKEKNGEAQIAQIMRQLMSALAYMHSLDIIHRDIKLDNIVFLPTQDRIAIKLIDFGTAVHAPRRPITGFPVAGTLSYLAPEAIGELLSEKSDVWSSGVLLHILLTGVSPFKGRHEGETRRNILKGALRFDKPPLCQISQQAQDLLRLMLASDPRKRISALEAVQHRWVSEGGGEQAVGQGVLGQLRMYERQNNFVAVIESFLALRRTSQQERQHLAEVFRSMDADGNGVISREQLLVTFQQLNGTHSEEEVQALARSLDINDSGKIDFNEFIIAMYDRRKLYLGQSLGEAFEHFDIDHTGFIQLEELRQMLKGGDKAEVDHFFTVIDTDDDKRISREEFIRYLLQDQQLASDS